MTYGGYIPVTGSPTTGAADAGTQAPLNIAFDPSGNARVVGGAPDTTGNTTTGNGAMTEITPGLSVPIPFISVGNPGNGALAIDGLGNVWTQGTTLLGFDNTGTQFASNSGAGVSGAGGYQLMETLIFDSKATSLWGSEPNRREFYQISPKDGSGIFDYSVLTCTLLKRSCQFVVLV